MSHLISPVLMHHRRAVSARVRQLASAEENGGDEANEGTCVEA